MEHIVQFGVTIDDDAIQRHVADKAAETIVQEIKKQLGIERYNRDSDVIRRMVENEVDNQFEKLGDRIVEAAADKLAEKLARTKKVKEATDKVLNEVLG